MTTEQVRAMLRKLCDGNQSKWAQENSVSAVYVSDVLSGKREPAGKLLAALGLERVVTYQKARGGRDVGSK